MTLFHAASRRAQVMVLSCVTMLVLVLMLMLSFNLNQAVHEKIRLQQHSDSMAYSMATIEARAMNYFAYSNRAIAAAAVSEMSIHAYMSVMTQQADAFAAAKWSFLMITIEECLVSLGCGPWCASCCEHIPHCVEAGIVYGKFNQATQKYDQAVEGVEQDFNRAVEAYSMFIDVLYAGQMSMGMHTLNSLRGDGLTALHDTNAPCASQLPMGVGALNMVEFACALEGTPIDSLCIGGASASSDDARSKVMANVANAARGDFPKTRMPGPLQITMWYPSALQDLMTGIQGTGITTPVPLGGSARAIDGVSKDDCTGDTNSKRGHTICAAEKTGVSGTFFYDFPGGWFFDAEVYSNRDGGDHKPRGHQGNHDKWKGFAESQMAGCLTEGECFVNFRSNTNKDDDFGQPSVYGYFSGNLRLNAACNKGPWELGTDGKLTINDGDHDAQVGDPGVLDFVPRKPGNALSRALVYFHRPDNWQMPPTMFDPYWKAKLHPFDHTEAAKVLAVSGDVEGAEMAVGPVEGVD